MQVSYVGINEKTPILCGSFEFIAQKNNDKFLFSSPLIRNTKNWKTQTVGNNIFYYQRSINTQKLKEFEQLANIFDKKPKVTDKSCEFYLTADFVALQKLIGVNYKLFIKGETNLLNKLSECKNDTHFEHLKKYNEGISAPLNAQKCRSLSVAQTNNGIKHTKIPFLCLY